MFYKKIGLLLAASGLSSMVVADDFPKLDQALPAYVDAASIAPVFDFDGDGCYPSAGISRNGDKNGGLSPTGALDGSCDSSNFMDTSNTIHRYVCSVTDATYCGHMYALYFEKDQLIANVSSGHRHDWEYVTVWTTNGNPTHATYSYHRTAVTLTEAEVPKDSGGHMKFVYHKDGASSHAIRVAGASEVAENPYGVFVTPTIATWYGLVGDGWNNIVMRTLLDNYSYDDANLPTTEGNFLNKINDFKPSNYPSFTQADATNANPNAEAVFYELVNNASGLCLDINNAVMANGTNVMQWTCSGEHWQRWYYESSSQLMRSKNDPRFCLDNGGTFAN